VRSPAKRAGIKIINEAAATHGGKGACDDVRARERRVMVSRLHCREIGECVHRLLLHAEPDSTIGRKLTAWIREREGVLGLDYIETIAPLVDGKRRKPADDKSLSKAAWQRLRTAVADVCAGTGQSDIAKNAVALAAALRLGTTEVLVFLFAALVSYDRAFETLCEQLAATRALTNEQIVAICIGANTGDVAAAMSGGALTANGLITGVESYPGRFDTYVPYDIMRALRPPICDIRDIEKALLGLPAKSQLGWTDFQSIARERDFIAKLLKGALAQEKSGVNVLLYGPPGTGKTELAKVIAQQIGAELYTNSEACADGDEPSRYDRLSALRLNERLLRHRGNSVLLFDEMEDILQGGNTALVDGRRIRRAGSKVHFNRMLEQNGVPIVWTANALEEFDPAFLRRMSFVLHMKPATRPVRAAQWTRIARRHGLPLDETAVQALALEHRIAPSMMENAVSAVSVAGCDARDVGFVVSALSRVVDRDQARPSAIAPAAHVDLINADRDLMEIERGLAGGPWRSVSFCFHGPSGTGKSAYARRLAETMGLEVLEKRGAELLSKWVGETEQRIAEAFEEAAAAQAFLIIDEVEGFLWSRGESRQSWETSMVNEFLTQFERHQGPVACTTNHLERIDPAALRRFTYKIKLDALTAAQREAAFVRFFSVPAPARLRELEGLALGDFGVVKKQVALTPDADAERLLAMLEAEVRAKPHVARRIGF
jgi:SpoVK/Ycf46/Vps4 family AAA+-type ATPase